MNGLISITGNSIRLIRLFIAAVIFFFLSAAWYADNSLLFYWLNGNPGFFKQLLLSLGLNEKNKNSVKRLVDLHGMKVDWLE